MENEVLSTYNNGPIQFQLLTPKYLDSACEVIKTTLFTYGHLNTALGVPDDPQALKELDQLVREVSKDGITVIAIDKNVDKVVGTAFNKIFVPTDTFFDDLRKQFKNYRSLQVLDFITSSENMCNLFEHLQIDCLMEILFLGTLPDYRKQGVARKLSEITTAIAQKLVDGVNVKRSMSKQEISLEPVPKAVTAIFNSFSGGIGRKLGFQTAAERNSGKMEIPGMNMEVVTPSVTLQYKLLKK